MSTLAMGNLHEGVSNEDRADSEVFLIEQGRVLDAGALTKVGRHLAARLNPVTDVHAQRAEAAQHTRRRFSLVEEPDGSWWVAGHLHGEGGRALNAALDPLAERALAGGTP